jgi:hypothetical protein
MKLLLLRYLKRLDLGGLSVGMIRVVFCGEAVCTVC